MNVQTKNNVIAIDIFDDKRWTTEENYENLIQNEKYCNYIKATYSVDNQTLF